MRVRTVPSLVITCLFAALCAAQVSAPAPTSGATPQPAASSPEMSADLTAYGEMLGELRDFSQRTAGDLGKLRIDKWKTDSANKQQSQSNTAALQRNLTAALPELIQKAQAAPQTLEPNFKLYRNLTALYDVLSATAENAGAFGPKSDYESLAADVAQLDKLRHNFADRLDWLAGVKDSQLVQLHQQLTTAQQTLAKEEKKKEEASASSTSTAAKKKTPTKKKKKPAAAETETTTPPSTPQ